MSHKSLKNTFDNLQKLSQGTHSLEKVFALAGFEFCPECRGSLKKENVLDPNGRFFAEMAYCEGCGYCEETT